MAGLFLTTCPCKPRVSHFLVYEKISLDLNKAETLNNSICDK